MAAADYLFDYKVTSSPTPTQKAKGQESSQKSESKTSKSNGGKGLKKPIHKLKWGRERLPRKLLDHKDATSAMGHIERETTQGRRSSMKS